jgi:transposase-like protein
VHGGLHLRGPAHWKCKACNHQFSVTSGTIFASRKLAIRDYLAATAIFVNAVKGISALQLGRDLDVQYKTAFVLAHKLREAIAKEQNEAQLSGVVEVDGPTSAGTSSRKPEGRPQGPPPRLRADRQATVGCCGPRAQWQDALFVVAKEADAVALLRERIAMGSIVHADEASGWDRLHAYYDVMRINHSVAFSGRRLHKPG